MTHSFPTRRSADLVRRWRDGFSARVTEDKMTISKGDRLPSTTFVKMTENGPEQVQSDDFFKGRKVALFSVPGAFTPTCSAKHLPGYIEKAGDLKAKGVDEIACTAVNDAFVMGAWGKRSEEQTSDERRVGKEGVS